MKKMMKILTVGMLTAVLLAGCGSKSNDEKTTNTQPEVTSESSTNIEGTITMNGSTSMEKLANSLNEVFASKYPKVNPSVQFTGSGAGIEAVANKTVDIGNSSRELKQEELDKGIVANVVAIDGIAIIVDSENGVSDLTTEQLINIYNGTITNWSEVGGTDLGIVVIGREAGSGTRGAFEEILGLKDKASYSQEIDSTGAVVGKVASTKGAIGYVSLDVVNDTIKSLSIDGITPTSENIKSNQYPLVRPFIMATNGDISQQSPQVQAFFEFIFSAEGKSIVEKVGLVAIN